MKKVKKSTFFANFIKITQNHEILPITKITKKNDIFTAFLKTARNLNKKYKMYTESKLVSDN